MKSAEDVAEEIYWSISIDEVEGNAGDQLIERIARALTAYADEQVKEEKEENERLRSALANHNKAIETSMLVKARTEALEEAAKVAEVSADYYSKGMKREDGTLNPTIGSAAQTSWDIAKAIRFLKGKA